MNESLIQIFFFLTLVLILIKPLGAYIAYVFDNTRKLHRYFTPIENFFYRLCGIDATEEMNWRQYTAAMLWFNLLGLLFVYLLQRVQAYLPLNPEHFANVSPALAFNTAVSFVSNTNWQAYGGETTMSYLTQMLALTAQNFLSGATGIAILVAFIRGLVGRETDKLGNFWVDCVRATLFILLPLALLFSILLVSQGVIQNLHPHQTVTVLQSTPSISTQVIPMGPVASQTAIEELGSNGGGFFNVNSAHPLQNPTALSNLLEMLMILLIPAALCYTYGKMVRDTRQGWSLLITMLLLMVPLIFVLVCAEQHGNFSLGNMEGKETRFGITNSALWTTITTAVANGSVNSMLDSYTPIGTLVPLWLMQLSEVVFGGDGSGLYSMIIMVMLSVFIAGLMVGRTPEYLGKKIEPYEIKLIALIILIMPLMVLIGTAVAVLNSSAIAATGNPGAHAFSEILYAFTSMTNNNGSALAGLNANIPFYNLLGGAAMLIGRYWIAIPVLAIAGSMAKKKIIATTAGTLPTHTALFIVLLMCVIVIVGALTFLPSLALGPIVESLQLR